METNCGQSICFEKHKQQIQADFFLSETKTNVTHSVRLDWKFFVRFSYVLISKVGIIRFDLQNCQVLLKSQSFLL